MAAFDTLKLARKLENTGLSRDKAELFSSTLNEAFMNSAVNGLPVEKMNEEQLADLAIKVWKQCEAGS